MGNHCGLSELAARAAASVTADVGESAGAGSGGYIPASLHQSELGIAVLAADLTRPRIASMPSFGSMR